MAVLALGLNHTTAPLALREQLAFAADGLADTLAELKQRLSQSLRGDAEVALLSTCNRTELYIANALHTPAPELLHHATQWLAAHKGLPLATLQKHLYQLHAHKTASQTLALAPVRHAYRVASGLDSMVLGEPQILGQMKTAMRAAQAANTLGPELHHVFQQSFVVAKAVRTQTALGAASVSMAAAAVRLAQRIFGDIAQCKVLLIGAGEMISLCATHFAGHAPLQLDVANRNAERAQALLDGLPKPSQAAQVTQHKALTLGQVPDALAGYDIVISCTASTLPIVGLGMVQRAMAARKAKKIHLPLMMVDLAVPRDIESEVAKLSDVYLYTVDDLGKVVQQGRESRAAAVAQAEHIIDAHVADYARWQSARRAVPVIQALQHDAQAIRAAELERALTALKSGADASAVLEQLSRQLTSKLLHGSLNLTHTLAADADTTEATLRQLHGLHKQNRLDRQDRSRHAAGRSSPKTTAIQPSL